MTEPSGKSPVDLEDAIQRAATWLHKGAPLDEATSTIRDVVKLSLSAKSARIEELERALAEHISRGAELAESNRSLEEYNARIAAELDALRAAGSAGALAEAKIEQERLRAGWIQADKTALNERLESARSAAGPTESPLAWVVFTPNDMQGHDYYVFPDEDSANSHTDDADASEPIPLYRASAFAPSAAAPSEAGKYPTDEARLLWLETTLEHCPHAELKHNNDPDEGPVGWSLVIESCTRMDLKAPTLTALIDLGITTAPDEDGDVIAAAPADAKGS